MIFNLISKAKELFYSNKNSNLNANNVQDAIDELNNNLANSIVIEDKEIVASASYLPNQSLSDTFALSKNGYSVANIMIYTSSQNSFLTGVNFAKNAWYYTIKNVHNESLTTAIRARTIWVKN